MCLNHPPQTGSVTFTSLGALLPFTRDPGAACIKAVALVQGRMSCVGKVQGEVTPSSVRRRLNPSPALRCFAALIPGAAGWGGGERDLLVGCAIMGRLQQSVLLRGAG